MRQMRGRRFVNAGGGGILKGAGIDQLFPGELASLCASQAPGGVHLFRDRYRERDNGTIRQATRDLARHLAAGDASMPVTQDWQAFAPGLTSEAIAAALRAAEIAFTPEHCGPPVPVVHSITTSPLLVETNNVSLQEIAVAVPLVPLVIPPHRMELAYSGARMFRFRTTAGTIMACAMRPTHDGVAEDGVPLVRVLDMDQVGPGTYGASGDAVHFRATDGSDPRANGRSYTILVPPPVVDVETLTLHEILSRKL
jgi:hypothetical protein